MPDLFGREPLPRHDLEDRAGGADPNALAAPGAACLVGIAVGADDDLGVLAAESHVQHAHHLNVLARAHAARTQDAGGHVVPDHGIAGPLVARAQRQVAIEQRRRHDVVLHQVALEFVARRRSAAPPVAQVFGGIALGQEPQHALAVLDRRVRPRRHHHPVRNRRRARRDQLGLALHRDEADAAVADDGKLGIPAQGGDVDAGRSGRGEDRVPLFRND
jgi:hypothetical protein